jgi:hypothetical protein
MCPKVDIWRIGSPKDVGRICLMYTFLTFGVGLRKAGSESTTFRVSAKVPSSPPPAAEPQPG